jgi:hypothetical protein
MFITPAEITAKTGYVVETNVVQRAQTMVESFVGRVEAEVTEATDKALLGHATMWQAIYIMEEPEAMLQQVAVKTMMGGDQTTVFDVEKFAPFFAPWAFKACERLSWRRSRTIRTGPVQMKPLRPRWEYE